MSTNISPEITEDSPWWIPRERYYELKHFCMQYSDWKRELRHLDGLQHQSPFSDIPKTQTNETPDPVGNEASVRASLSKRVEMVEKAAKEAGADLHSCVLKGITEGVPYSVLRMKICVPCNRNEYYERYRKFFWLLDKLRD